MYPRIGFNIQHKSSLKENQRLAADSLAEQTCAYYSLPYPTGPILQSSLTKFKQWQIYQFGAFVALSCLWSFMIEMFISVIICVFIPEPTDLKVSVI